MSEDQNTYQKKIGCDLERAKNLIELLVVTVEHAVGVVHQFKHASVSACLVRISVALAAPPLVSRIFNMHHCEMNLCSGSTDASLFGKICRRVLCTV